MADGWHADPPSSNRVAIVGMTGSGKSSALKELFAEQYPRVIVLDHLGTQWPKWDGATVVYSYPDAMAFLRRVAPRSKRWRLVCCFPEGSDDVLSLFELLSPDPRKGTGFPGAVHGVALVMDELSKVAPHGCDPAILSAWSNGRHVGLTILGAAQRPSQVARIVTASTDWLGVCRMHEPADLAIVQEYSTAQVLDEVRRLPNFGLVLYNTLEGTGKVIHSPGRGRYKVVRELGANPDIKPSGKATRDKVTQDG